MGMMGECINGVGWGMGFLGMGAMAAFWGAIGAAILYLVRGGGRGARVPAGAHGVVEDGALATLRERYARGEIGAEEYAERRRLLAGDERAWP